MGRPSVEIVAATTPHHWALARALLEEYADSLDFDLCFQDFEQELAGAEALYSPPEGLFLLALADRQAVGCVALHRISTDIREMKRLYLRPAFRGRGLGRQLAEAIIAEARRAGYRRMRLDTVPSMGEARSLYRSLGFSEIPAYRHNPIPGALFLGLDLAPL